MTTIADSQDKDVIELDPNFSTTRLVTREKPTIANNSSSEVQALLFLPPTSECKGEGGLRTKGYFKHSYNESNNLSSYSSLPLVTIITVVFNGEKYLEQTIQSVINQTYDNIEYIVIDGGSTDGTVDIIRKYEDKIDYWVSNLDDGLYDAINKGIALCTGKILGIIHAGDSYTLQATSQIVEAYLRSLSQSILVGNCKCFFRDGSKWYIRSGSSIPLPYHTLPHPPAFVPIEVYRSQGVFDTLLKIASDYDFFCRCYKQSVSFVHVNQVIAVASFAGLSSNYYSVVIEELKVRLRHKLPIFRSVSIFIFSYLTVTGHLMLEYLGLWNLIEARRHGSIRSR